VLLKRHYDYLFTLKLIKIKRNIEFNMIKTLNEDYRIKLPYELPFLVDAYLKRSLDGFESDYAPVEDDTDAEYCFK
jgi:hypothetical protein